jgi:hypothetical protein
MATDIDRRDFWVLLAGGLMASASCSVPVDPAATALPRLLGLSPSELSWLAALNEPEQQQLRDALLSRGQPTPQTIELLMKVLGRRERLFPYVGYPPLPNSLTACDGLLRE